LFEFRDRWTGCACGAALGKPQVLRLRLRMTDLLGGSHLFRISASLSWMRLRRGFGQTAGPSATPQDDICLGNDDCLGFSIAELDAPAARPLGKPRVPSLRSGQALRLRLRMTFVWGMAIVWSGGVVIHSSQRMDWMGHPGPSAAEAALFRGALMARLKPCPFKDGTAGQSPSRCSGSG
jgi:hypothetical protein